jgi:hypothetical protein
MKITVTNDVLTQALEASHDSKETFANLYNMTPYTHHKKNPALVEKGKGNWSWSIEFVTEPDAIMFLLRFS